MAEHEKDNKMYEGRRIKDHRMEAIKDQVKEVKSEQKDMRSDITYIKTRIDDGFSTSIKSTEDKVDYIDKENKEAHGMLSVSIAGLGKKLDKLLWAIAIGSAGLIITQIIHVISTT